MRSLTLKLVFAFLTIGLISVAIVVLLARQNTRDEFNRFVIDRRGDDLVTQLTEYYESTGSWNGVQNTITTSSTPPPSPRPLYFTIADSSGYAIITGGGFQTGDLIPQQQLSLGIPISTNGKTVGILIMSRVPFPGNSREEEFIQRVNMLLLYSALGASLVALFLGILLSRTLTRPIRELTHATHAIAQGDYDQQVTIHSRDELGELAQAFNKMSSELARSINARKQMTADIAHELRTPLSLILGHAEAVHDGVLPPTNENFEIIREEAGRLEHLVDDLRTLSLADAGELSVQPEIIAPDRLLQEVATIYRYQVQKKNVTLDVETASPLPNIEVDPGRLTQVLTNLLDNALRHTPEGGHIILAASPTPDGVELSVRDSGPGLAASELERIFDRFYRADASRTRGDGGSGLGLAIAKSIVQAHNGSIRAESEEGKGLKMIITLPSAEKE